MEKIQADNPEFKLALGDEVYLTDTRDRSQKFYHFLLIFLIVFGTYLSPQYKQLI